ncbi:MAG: N-acetylmuramoyl-L-alanine amidase [Ilumatobacteraceae bacterium]
MGVDTSTDPDATRVAVDGLADCDDDDAFDASDPPPGTTPRGGRMLTDLADVLRGAGLAVKEVDGWTTRARDSGGYRQEGPVAIIVHHTASGAKKDGDPDVQEQTFTCSVRPMANLYLDRKGQFWVMAAGATNTNGKGGPLGPLPLDSANSRVIGIEAGNNGIGEPWPEAMQDAYVAGVAALADQYAIPTARVYAHFEWAPGRKIDPAGPSRFGTINASQCWNMDAFRAAVEARRNGSPGPVAEPAQPTPATTSAGTYVVQPGDSWWSIAAATIGDPATTWPAVAAANGGPQRVLRPGEVVSIPGGTAGGGGGGAPTSPTAPTTPPVPGGVPPFPGSVEAGDSGPAVLAWQEALIAAGVIRDKPANRDSVYGEGMRKAVLKLQTSWDWDDADGKAGEHTWSKLHGGP